MTTEGIATLVSAVAGLLSAVAAALGIWIASRVHRSQQLLAQRQLLVPLWEHISPLNRIDPKHPVTPDVVRAANTLELIALCCEGGMVDERVIKRTFRRNFMELYEAIETCDTLPGLPESGRQILAECRAASKFYLKLRDEHLAADQIDQRIG